ncbi:MAG: trigger factor [Lachnospiraceae bacterium]|nr:trigger factor [Lachnospiraceae bacterium]
MNVKVETLEKNTAKIIVEVSAAEFEDATVVAYNKNKNKFNIPGFRKGHAKKEVIEKMYGVQVFYEDALNHILDTTYPKAAKESGLEIVSRPEIDVEKIEKGQPIVYTATVATKPAVELGEYKGVEVEKADASVVAKDVDAELKRIQNQNARIVTIEDENRKLKNDDIAVIKFEGFVDGKAFAGGSGDDYPLTIGSHSFIEGFEEQLVGHKKGDEVDVNVTFPVPYQAKELEGKPALFKVTVKEIREKQLPAIDDEFASEVSEFETLKEYKASIKADLKLKKENAATQENENRVVRKVVENASVELPDAMVQTAVENMMNDYARRLSQQGLTIEQYLGYMGMTPEAFMEAQKPDTADSIKTRLVLEEIVKKENITPSEESVDAKLTEMANMYKMDLEKFKSMITDADIQGIKDDLAIRDAVDMLVAEAVLKAPEKKSKKAAEEKEEAPEA